MDGYAIQNGERRHAGKRASEETEPGAVAKKNVDLVVLSPLSQQDHLQAESNRLLPSEFAEGPIQRQFDPLDGSVDHGSCDHADCDCGSWIVRIMDHGPRIMVIN